MLTPERLILAGGWVDALNLMQYVPGRYPASL